jgi:hypothetical protein
MFGLCVRFTCRDADRAAFDAHEAQPHTRRFLDARGQYLASFEVDFLSLLTGKGTDGCPGSLPSPAG